MIETTVKVDGMMCGMCEAHVNDAVRKACPVKKVSSSRSKNQTVILSETELDTEVLMNAIRGTGYEVGAIQKEPYKKEDYSVEFIGGSGQKRGVNMNTAMQSFGYGLAALLFCIAVLGVCYNIKKPPEIFEKTASHIRVICRERLELWSRCAWR